MIGSMFVFGIVGIGFLLMLGVFVAIGVIVYKDAKAHGLNAWLWAAIALFTPNFIGLIIYLVVRSETQKEAQCSNCGAKVLMGYNICPECRAVFEKRCAKCNQVVKETMSICPYCGELFDEHETMPTASKVYKKAKIAKPLGITLAIFFLGFMLLMGTLFITTWYDTYRIQKTGLAMLKPSVSVMSIGNNIGNRYSQSFKFKEGQEVKKFTLKEGKHLGLKGHVKVQKGSIKVEIIDEEDNFIYEETFKKIEKDIKLPQKIEGEKAYTVIVTFNKAKGNIEISPM